MLGTRRSVGILFAVKNVMEEGVRLESEVACRGQAHTTSDEGPGAGEALGGAIRKDVR